MSYPHLYFPQKKFLATLTFMTQTQKLLKPLIIHEPDHDNKSF